MVFTESESLTRKQVETMRAGAEMDALVAGLVLRLPVPYPLPYSTRIEYAWEVVRTMTERGWHYAITGTNGGTAIVTFRKLNEQSTHFERQETAGGKCIEEAICRAALLATLDEE